MRCTYRPHENIVSAFRVEGLEFRSRWHCKGREVCKERCWLLMYTEEIEVTFYLNSSCIDLHKNLH